MNAAAVSKSFPRCSAAATAFGPEAVRLTPAGALEAWSANHDIAGMGSSSKDVTAPSPEEATLLRVLTELEKAARTNAAGCSPEAIAVVCERLHKLVTEISSGAGAAWHP